VHAEVRQVGKEEADQRGVGQGAEEIHMRQHDRRARSRLQNHQDQRPPGAPPQVGPAVQTSRPDDQDADSGHQEQRRRPMQQIDDHEIGQCRHRGRAKRPAAADIVGIDVPRQRPQIDNHVAIHGQAPDVRGVPRRQREGPQPFGPIRLKDCRRGQQDAGKGDQRDAEVESEYGGQLRGHDGPRPQARLQKEEEHHDRGQQPDIAPPVADDGGDREADD